MNKFQCLLYVYQSRHRCNGNSRLEDSDTESPSSHCRCISCPSQSTKSTPRTPTQTPENIIVKDSLPTYNNCDTEKKKIRSVAHTINGTVEKKLVKDFSTVPNNQFV